MKSTAPQPATVFGDSKRPPGADAQTRFSAYNMGNRSHNMTARDLRFRNIILLSAAFLLILTGLCFASPSAGEAIRWQQRARNVTITRDDWGIAHVVGKTDADTV